MIKKLVLIGLLSISFQTNAVEQSAKSARIKELCKTISAAEILADENLNNFQKEAVLLSCGFKKALNELLEEQASSGAIGWEDTVVIMDYKEGSNND